MHGHLMIFGFCLMKIIKGMCSIIIPVYNRAHLIEATLDSCLSQDYENIELVVVDDGSKDNSLAVCKEYAKRNSKFNIKVISQNNGGACSARNEGMRHSHGEYVMFLDSDDYISKRKLSLQIQKIIADDADFCICDYSIVDLNGNLIREVKNNKGRIGFIRNIISPSNSAILMRRNSIPELLKWNDRIKKMQDVDFMLRYMLTAQKLTYLPISLYFYRMHDGDRISDNYSSGMQYFELFKSFERYAKASKLPRLKYLYYIFPFGYVLFKSALREYILKYTPIYLKNFFRRMIKT